jgi:purine nucleosidase
MVNQWHSVSMPRIILDTDIGTDVDDLLALALLAKTADVDLCGVTTVQSDTTLRARVAQYVCQLLKRSETVIIPGEMAQ